MIISFKVDEMKKLFLYLFLVFLCSTVVTNSYGTALPVYPTYLKCDPIGNKIISKDLNSKELSYLKFDGFGLLFYDWDQKDQSFQKKTEYKERKQDFKFFANNNNNNNRTFIKISRETGILSLYGSKELKCKKIKKKELPTKKIKKIF